MSSKYLGRKLALSIFLCLSLCCIHYILRNPNIQFSNTNRISYRKVNNTLSSNYQLIPSSNYLSLHKTPTQVLSSPDFRLDNKCTTKSYINFNHQQNRYSQTISNTQTNYIRGGYGERAQASDLTHQKLQSINYQTSTTNDVFNDYDQFAATPISRALPNKPNDPSANVPIGSMLYILVFTIPYFIIKHIRLLNKSHQK